MANRIGAKLPGRVIYTHDITSYLEFGSIITRWLRSGNRAAMGQRLEVAMEGGDGD